jgi:poly(3-hydroxybutyrate) depolymerase
MRFILCLALSLATTILSAQCDGSRFLNRVFPDLSVTSNVQYGSNTDRNGATQTLTMDIYEPNGDVAANRPLVVMCHGGFFLSGDKAAPDVVPLSEDLARMGYVVASINYRMGASTFGNIENSFAQAVMRAVQDLNAAIRWFRKNAAEDGNTFGIDTENIFTFGTSAGAFMVLQQAYMDNDEIPAFLDTTAPGLTGGVEGESGNAGYSSVVKGLVSHCGAMGDNAWIDADEQTPACLFHGQYDTTVPNDSSMLTLAGIFPVAVVEGSYPISERMTALGIEHCFEINDNVGHVAYLTNQAVYDTTLSISSNFLAHLVCGIELDCTYREVMTGNEEELNSTFKIFPNPANDVVNFSINKLMSYTMFDIQGKPVESGNSSRMSTAHLPNGIYLLQLQDNFGQSQSARIIVSHE